MKIPTPTVIVGSGYFLTSFSNHMKYTEAFYESIRVKGNLYGFICYSLDFCID